MIRGRVSGKRYGADRVHLIGSRGLRVAMLVLWALGAPLLLSACASGGGSGSPSSPPSEPDSPSEPPPESEPDSPSEPPPEPEPDSPSEPPPDDFSMSSIPLGASDEGDLAPVRATSLSLGRAFGSGPDLGKVIVLDGSGRPHWLNLQDRTTATASTLDLLDWLAPAGRQADFSGQVTPSFDFGVSLAADRRPEKRRYDEREAADRFVLAANLGRSRFSILHGWDPGFQFGLSTETRQSVSSLLSGPAFGSPYIRLVGDADGIALTQELDDDISLRVGFVSDKLSRSTTGSDAWVVEVIGKPWTAAHIGFQLGSALEDKRLLGAEGNGALDLPTNSSTIFTRLASTLHLNDRLEVFGQASLGVTDPARSDVSLLREVSALRSSSFGVGMARRRLFTAGDRLTVAVAQPLRVEAGSAVIDRPVGWTDGRILRRRERISLEPKGREVDIEFGYQVPLGHRGNVGLNWLSQLEPGHDRDAAPAHILAIRLRAEF